MAKKQGEVNGKERCQYHLSTVAIVTCLLNRADPKEIAGKVKQIGSRAFHERIRAGRLIKLNELLDNLKILYGNIKGIINCTTYTYRL
jgi:hypothetical protein